MGKFNGLEIESGGTMYVFVTRGRSKPFTLEEAMEYLDDLGRDSEAEEVKQDVSEWEIPDDKGRKIMFLRDLNMGLEFCMNKYGVSKEQIIAEAQRIAPHLTLRNL